jgi:hypothetical protein
MIRLLTFLAPDFISLLAEILLQPTAGNPTWHGVNVGSIDNGSFPNGNTMAPCVITGEVLQMTEL